MSEKKTILCVDDEESILGILNKLLQREGYEVLVSNDAKRALKMLSETPVDLVISDQRMPEMDGTTFLSQVKVKYPHIVRIMMSGYSDFDSLVSAVNEGEIFRFIAKPWQREQLLGVISAALNQREVIGHMEGVVRNVCAMVKLAEKTSVEVQGDNQCLTVKIGEPEDAFPREVILDFLRLLMQSLGMKDETAWTGQGSITQQDGKVSISIDIGRGVMLKVIVPKLKG